jgi:hypothetical protein
MALSGFCQKERSGRSLTEFLLARRRKVRALVRREDARAEVLRRLGARS